MAEIRDRRSAQTIKWLSIGLAICVVIIIILAVSRWAVISPWLIAAITILTLAFMILQFLLSVKRKKDIIDAVKDIRQRLFESKVSVIPTSDMLKNWKGDTIGQDQYIIWFADLGRSFIWDHGMITGSDPRDHQAWIAAKEKSKFTEKALDSQDKARRAKDAATAAGLEVPGVTDQEEEDD